MIRKFDSVLRYWKNEYSNEVDKYHAYNTIEQFKQVGALFAPGNSYFYILNFHNLELDFINPGIGDFLDIPPEEVTMENLLALALPSEVDSIMKKEAVIRDFFTRYLSADCITSYKVLYTYKMKDFKGVERVILHQATALTLTAEGAMQHVFSLHSDISHLKTTSNNEVSFINMKGGKSYCNVDIQSGRFNPQDSVTQNKNLCQLLSEREKEIVHNLALGENAEQIARKLHLSVHTVRTHRKNILQKSGCGNTSELVAKCVTGGVISPSF